MSWRTGEIHFPSSRSQETSPGHDELWLMTGVLLRREELCLVNMSVLTEARAGGVRRAKKHAGLQLEMKQPTMICMRPLGASSRLRQWGPGHRLPQ